MPYMPKCSIQCGNDAVAEFYSDFVNPGGDVYLIGPYPICEMHAELLGRNGHLTEVHYPDGTVKKFRDPARVSPHNFADLARR